MSSTSDAFNFYTGITYPTTAVCSPLALTQAIHQCVCVLYTLVKPMPITCVTCATIVATSTRVRRVRD
jgi:hypothetical protein